MPGSPPHRAAVGEPLARVEDRRLLTGRAAYVDDVERPRMLHACVVRSPYASARVGAVDAAGARALAGTVAVLTHADLEADLGPEPRRIPIRLCPDDALERFLQPPLAAGRVRYVGEPVALVVAESRAAAEDAAALVEADYAPLPAATDPARPPEVPIFDAAPDNVVSVIEEGFGDAAAALAAAAHVVEMRFAVGRHGAVPLETRGLVAEPDPAGGRLTVWGPTKVTHFNRSVLAAMLGWPEHRVRLVEPDVGGGFGARGEFYPEDFLIPYAALRLGRAVKWIEDRGEHLMACNHSREQRYALALALAADGRMLALTADVVNDMGGYLRTHGTVVPGLSAGMLPGPYRLAAYRCAVRCVLTNKTPTGTYRAPGRFECNAARERLIDRAAEVIGADPLELRRANLLRPEDLPHRTGTTILGEDVVYDSGDYPLALAEAARISDYRARRREGGAGGGRAGGRVRRGIGLACFVEKTATGPFEGARVLLDPSGEVVVATGAANLGQGLETCLTQIAAEALGLEPAAITVRHGDTDLIPYGVGSFASRATVMAGNAVHAACLAVRAQLTARAAERLGVEPDAIETPGGGILRGPDGRTLTYRELAAAAGPGAGGGGIDVTHYYHAHRMTYAHGVAVAAVRVDTRTGNVVPERIWVTYDVGRVVNPRLVAGQIEGGVAQGIGGALLEEFRYDAEGQLLTGSLAEYLLPGMCEVPRVTHLNLDRSPSPLNPLGVKGAGEAGIAGVGGALANAVAHALGPQGAGAPALADALPMTPERVWGWLAGRAP